MADQAASSSPRDRATGPATDTESAFAAVLADVLRTDRVSLDGNFFDELGADSLVMAQFCARVRKRGGLPSVSMRDVYQHPTIRRLAAALGEVASLPARPAAAVPIDVPTVTSTREYVLCGALQALFYLGYCWVAVLATARGYEWISAGAHVVETYLRAVLFSAAAFLVVCTVPIAAKWMLIGRWKPQRIRLWSLGYVRFWLVKTLIRSSPAAHLFVGSPLQLLYLRALGAKIGPGVVILSRCVPVCTDLLTIGAGSVIRKEALFPCYRAHAGRIETGAVTLGREVYVGERSVLDIQTSMGDGAQLGHTSALHSGQEVPSGERWHGSPAQPTSTRYLRIAPARCGTLRRVAFSAFTLLSVLLVYLPLLGAGVDLLVRGVSSWLEVPDPIAGSGAMMSRGLLAEALLLSLVFYFGVALAGLLLVGTAPRVLNLFIKPDRVYPLYGFHHWVHRAIAAIGRIRFFTYLFGDSSYIVHYLRLVGCDLSRVVQTGSNFGIEVRQSNPLLSSVGSGTMVADGLDMVNEDVSSTSFRLSRVSVGADNFVGNDVTYPAGGRTGANCLLGTKAMVPLDGERFEGVGLLGSPCFVIPRSVERDSRFDHLRQGDALRRGLAAKNRYNLRTIGIFLVTRWLGVFIVTGMNLAALELHGVMANVPMAALFALGLVVGAVYFALVEPCVAAFRPLQPTICSIYDPAFWLIERLWKVHPIRYLHAFDGTPFKSLLWRLMGVRIGKRVFDDGVHISEQTLTTIGDDCVLNDKSKILCHSQEDGTFKSDRTTIGAGCTVGVGAFVHYGVTMGDGSALAADTFLMKGEYVPPRARWGGNPAREL